MPSARNKKISLKLPKPRNPLVAPAAQRQAGAHGKSPAAQRRADKMALQKALREHGERG